MTSIVIKGGADFSANAVGFRAPVSSGLVGWLFIGGRDGDTSAQKIARSTRNMAFNDYTAVVVGSPTISTGYATLTAANYIQTDIPETESFTLLAVMRNPDTLANAAHNPAIINTAGPNTLAEGRGIYFVMDSGTSAPPGRLRTYVSYGTAGSGTTTTGIVSPTDLASQFEFVYATADDAAGAYTLGSRTEGVNGSGSFTAGARLLNAAGNPFRIGAAYSTSVAAGSVDLAFAAIYDRSLSPTEIGTVYEFVQAYLDAKYSLAI